MMAEMSEESTMMVVVVVVVVVTVMMSALQSGKFHSIDSNYALRIYDCEW